MAVTARTRLVNPRLGTYFGIFTAAFVGAGADGADVRAARRRRRRHPRSSCSPGPSPFMPPSACCLRRRETGDYFVCGRRVPAFFNGLVLAISALGGAGFLALTGAFFIVGFDALCLALGVCAGLVFMGVLLAPFLRKFGAYTMPSYLGRRFESRTLRVVAAAVLAVPLLLLLAAEARFAAYACGLADGPVRAPDGGVVVACATAMVIAGGMRSLTWSSVGQGHRGAAGAGGARHHRRPHDVQPAAAADDARQRAARAQRGRRLRAALPIFMAPPLAFDFPAEGLEPLAKRFIQAFGSVGSLGFVLMTLLAAAGIAASPSLLLAAGHDARRLRGAQVARLGGAGRRHRAADAAGRRRLPARPAARPGDRPAGRSPADVVPAPCSRRASPASPPTPRRSASPTSASSATRRCSRCPFAAGFPQVLVYLALAGALAAALAALAAALVATAAILSEDVVHGLRPEDGRRRRPHRHGARWRLLGAAFVTAWLAIAAPADPLQAVPVVAHVQRRRRSFPCWCCRSGGSASTPGARWRACSPGCSSAAFAILLGEAGAWALPGVLAGTVGLPAGVAATIAASLHDAAPGPSVLHPRARDARARRRDALRSGDPPAAAQDTALRRECIMPLDLRLPRRRL